jgi:hypothetical protein
MSSKNFDVSMPWEGTEQFNPHYSSNLLKMNANAGYLDLVKPNFGQQNGL